jgi:hypothetical protein
MAVRSVVVEAAGVRSSERRRACADSSKRASVPDAEPPPRRRARWVDALYSPRAPVSLTRRLRRAVAVWPEEPGLTPASAHPSTATSPSSHLLLHRRCTAPPRPAPPPARRRHARRRHARRRLRLRLRSAACAALPLPRDACAATPALRRGRLRPACAATPHAKDAP